MGTSHSEMMSHLTKKKIVLALLTVRQIGEVWVRVRRNESLTFVENKQKPRGRRSGGLSGDLHEMDRPLGIDFFWYGMTCKKGVCFFRGIEDNALSNERELNTLYGKRRVQLVR